MKTTKIAAGLYQIVGTDLYIRKDTRAKKLWGGSDEWDVVTVDQSASATLPIVARLTNILITANSKERCILKLATLKALLLQIDGRSPHDAPPNTIGYVGD